MSILIYYHKNNFDVQKAQRYLKERRIPFQLVDLKKHKLSKKELTLFAQQLGAKNLIDREDKKTKEHPICYFNEDHFILDALLENPGFLRCPIIRCGGKVLLGFDQKALEALLNANG